MDSSCIFIWISLDGNKTKTTVAKFFGWLWGCWWNTQFAWSRKGFQNGPNNMMLTMAVEMTPEIALTFIWRGAREPDCKPLRKLSRNKIDEDHYLCCNGLWDSFDDNKLRNGFYANPYAGNDSFLFIEINKLFKKIVVVKNDLFGQK